MAASGGSDMTKKILLGSFVLTLVLAGVASAGPADLSAEDAMLCHPSSNAPISRVKPGPHDYGKREVVDLESKLDGEAIHMGYVRPKTPPGMKVPVIIFASPYLDHNLNNDDLVNCTKRLVQNFVSHGYAIGLVAVRGTSDSGGCSDLMGNAERADLNQAVNWFGTRPWSNGRIGMVGVSYDGSTPWEVASMGNKYLKTIVPISGVNDIFHLMYRNGAPEFRAPVILNALYYLYGFQEDNVTEGRSVEHTVSGIVCPEAFKGFYASIDSTFTGERDALGYWAERNSRPGVEKNYRGSIFLVHGLQDWNVDPAHDFPWIYELERRGLYVKYLLGQWSHAWPDSNPSVSVVPKKVVRWDWAELLLDWWDYWLKGDRSVDLGPRVQVQDSLGEWRNEAAWPPAQSQPTKLFLGGDGALLRRPTADAGEVTIGFDPLRLASNVGPSAPCAACATFATEPMDKEFRFAGIPELDLEVTPLGPGGFVSAWLYQVTDEGSARRVGWGMVDLRFAEGDGTPRQVNPGHPIKVHLPLEPLDVVIPAGDQLVLVLSEGSYGAPDHLPTSIPFPMRVKVGGRNAPLTIDAFEARRGSFFTPPDEPPPQPQ